MKKLLKVVLVLLLAVGIVACGGKETSIQDDKKLVVSATLDPHAKILEEAKKVLKEKYEIDLEVKVLDDYYIFNKYAWGIIFINKTFEIKKRAGS